MFDERVTLKMGPLDMNKTAKRIAYRREEFRRLCAALDSRVGSIGDVLDHAQREYQGDRVHEQEGGDAKSGAVSFGLVDRIVKIEDNVR